MFQKEVDIYSSFCWKMSSFFCTLQFSEDTYFWNSKSIYLVVLITTPFDKKVTRRKFCFCVKIVNSTDGMVVYHKCELNTNQHQCIKGLLNISHL